MFGWRLARAMSIALCWRPAANSMVSGCLRWNGESVTGLAAGLGEHQRVPLAKVGARARAFSSTVSLASRQEIVQAGVPHYIVLHRLVYPAMARAPARHPAAEHSPF